MCVHTDSHMRKSLKIFHVLEWIADIDGNTCYSMCDDNACHLSHYTLYTLCVTLSTAMVHCSLPYTLLMEIWMADLVTSIHENWFSARCINTSKPAGEGAIVIQTAAYILVAL